MDITMSMEPSFIDDLGCFPASLLLPQIDDRCHLVLGPDIRHA